MFWNQATSCWPRARTGRRRGWRRCRLRRGRLRRARAGRLAALVVIVQKVADLSHVPHRGKRQRAAQTPDRAAPAALGRLDIPPPTRESMRGRGKPGSGMACVMSLRWPPVRINRTGRPWPSTAMWIFVLRPPGQRPRAGCVAPFFRSPPVRASGQIRPRAFRTCGTLQIHTADHLQPRQTKPPALRTADARWRKTDVPRWDAYQAGK